MKKLFGGIKMTWPRVLLFAAVTGIYTGLVMLVPFLKNTSFRDIGISYECWVVFAVFVVVNCDRGWEAMLKCFVFFIISQPLVYAVEVLLGDLTFEMAKLYYTKIWLPMTVLTLPGGFVAWFCKKQNIPGGIVLGLGNAILLIMGAYYACAVVNEFPYHLLTCLGCFGSAVGLTLLIQEKKSNRILALGVGIGVTVLALVLCRLAGLTFYSA